MKQDDTLETAAVSDALRQALNRKDLAAAADVVAGLSTSQALDEMERLNSRDRAVTYRLLGKDRALAVFERLDATLQSELVQGLQDADVAEVFAGMTPDDRVALLDEVPAAVARRLLLGLSVRQRTLTNAVLGYGQGSIGRSMSPEFIAMHPWNTVEQALARVRAGLDDAETVYTLPVVDSGRKLVGVVSLRDLLRGGPGDLVGSVMAVPESVPATLDEESAARRCADLKILALPVVDAEDRLLGILTVDDALQILEDAESEDAARTGGSEPLRRPYLSTPVWDIVKSRVVWLLVLAIGATLTVQVLAVFEATLEQQVVLSLFIPLLIGTGGNTGNQAATTVTRALALGDVRTRDIFRVLAREVRVGATLGLLLGAVGLLLAGLLYSPALGWVIGLTLLGVCTLAATVGGMMPLLGKALRADPAVFSNPFISTFVDAAGLVLYFLVATVVLRL
ncbi:magnesium transporter [Arthrobacter sp. JSM 101049]|uniref:magnesium transporter n=1 Tax=Arthrobacter sp. JSM 101049 TaxID=929097 RepID=UPI0035693AB7